ncbi:beta-mannosidase [Bacteroides ovatus]|uniref:beta-mannosidase n=1 Tax=Bacteroides ovatus TaxID=28116 RepID=UPI00321B9EBC
MMLNRLINIFFFSLFLLNVPRSTAATQSVEINEGWKFRQARLNNWYPAIVPGTVHTDLMNNKIIEDPYFRLNERAVQWVDKEDWIYETTFNIPANLMNKKNLRFFFKGLDTYADVYLNGTKILEANNMFREWKVDVKHLLKASGNTLKVYFHSPIKKTLALCDSSEIKYWATDASDLSQNGGVLNKKLSPYVRKAGYHFGWDWGPRLVTSGIWRPVILEAWDDIKIENIHIQQENVTNKKADITAVVEILADHDILDAKIRIDDVQGHKVLGTVTTNLKKGKNIHQVRFSIKNPRLWWSRGLGEQHLYDFATQVFVGNNIIDSQIDKIGIRSIKVFRQPDEIGLGFHFELNGVPIFTKGANFIPCDIFLPRITKEVYKQTILDAADVNMNMLRIWGGGIYEDDYLYELCDQYGILVWQDFMFACKTYPATGAFMENIRQEAIDNIRRLRNHACLAIWCGNNEIMEALLHWGNDGKGWLNEIRKVNPKYADVTWEQYYDLFHVVLPGVVKEYAPQSFYLPSSPFTDMQATHSEKMGDVHYWTAWSKMLPISTFNEVKSRYFSEYGFQSFPIFESVKRYAPEERDWDIYSEVMMWHQRGGMTANKRIETCMINDFGQPKDFVSKLYLSQVLQGEAMKIAMESHRRNMPFCMGSLFWQINDCWPVASWSTRDYYGRWKAQHYFTRKAFDDVLVTANKENKELAVYTVSDRLKGFKAKLCITLITMEGKEVCQYEVPINVPANTSTKCFTVPEDELLKGHSGADVIAKIELKEKGGRVYKNNYCLLSQKQMNYPTVHINTSIIPINGGYELSLTSDKLAKYVLVSLEDEKATFSDNFIDIMPGETEKIIIKTRLDEGALLKKLKIKSLSDSIVK